MLAGESGVFATSQATPSASQNSLGVRGEWYCSPLYVRRASTLRVFDPPRPVHSQGRGCPVVDNMMATQNEITPFGANPPGSFQLIFAISDL